VRGRRSLTRSSVTYYIITHCRDDSPIHGLRLSGIGISVVYLFGSCVRSEAKTTSDIDISILLERVGKELYSSYCEIMLGVQEVLGSERFDLLLLHDAPPTLKFTIITRGYPIYFRDEEMLNKCEMDAISRFQDTAYLRAVQNRYLKGRASSLCE